MYCVSVVNCFQNLCRFASETTVRAGCQIHIRLLIAFKICVDLHRKQLVDLLCNLDLLWIAFKICVDLHRKQLQQTAPHLHAVVNCFQNLCRFASETTCCRYTLHSPRLWIAFKICVDLHRKQHDGHITVADVVVNCFQNLCRFASETTYGRRWRWPPWLWIAFKICVDLHRKQRLNLAGAIWLCCELLSKFV